MKRIVTACALLLLAASLAGQTSSGVIDGSVIDDRGAPIPRASVSLMTEAGRVIRSMDADDRGLFLFDSLADGRYILSASRLGYSTRVYGETTPHAGVVVVALATNGRYRARVRLPRVGVITGTIADERGQPLAAEVRAQRFVMRNGQRLVDDRVIRTIADQQGRYRFVDLATSEYLISAWGPNGELRLMSPELIQRAHQALQQRMLPLPDGPVAADAPVSYVPVYFPGVTNRARATPVALGPGEERADVNLQLQVVPAPRPPGTVAGAEGQPAGGSLTGRVVFDGTASRPDCLRTPCKPVLQARGSAGTAGLADISGVMDEAGPVIFPTVPLGAYILGMGVPLSGWTMASAIIDGQDAMDLPIDVGPRQDLTGLVVTFTDRETELRGTTVVGGASPTADLVSIVAFPADQRFWIRGARRVRIARPDTRGEYRITGLPPGEYLVAVVTNFDAESELDATRLGTLQASASRTTVRAPEPR